MDKEFLSYFNEGKKIFSCASLRIIPQFLPGSFKTNYMIHHASLEMHFPNIFQLFFFPFLSLPLEKMSPERPF